MSNRYVLIQKHHYSIMAGPASIELGKWQRSEAMQTDFSPSRRITRRTALAGTAATLAILAGRASAQPDAPDPRVKGPAVWLGMDQTELDDAYDQASYNPNLPHTVRRCAANSELVRARLG